MLRQVGYRVETARDGASAVEAVRSGCYDLVLMDVQMSGMDGLAATQAIRGLGTDRSKVPIVAMTANVYADQIAIFLSTGMNDHIAKPFRMPQLLATVDKWIPPPFTASRAAERGAPTSPDTAQDGIIAPPDTETISHLKRLLGAERLNELLTMFQGELSARFKSHPMGPDAIRVLRQEAHSTIAQAGMLGFDELSQCCRNLQDACKEGGDVRAALAVLSDAQARALAALHTIDLGASDKDVPPARARAAGED
jgi:CheY-like chemotaxis protein